MNEFAKNIMSNKMLEAKEVFLKTMQEKQVQAVSELRKEIAKDLFNKKPQ